MSEDGVSNTAETAEAVLQNVSDSKTTAEPRNNGEQVEGSLVGASAEVPETTIAPEGTEVKTSEDANDAQTTEGNVGTTENTAEIYDSNEGDQTNATKSETVEDTGKTITAISAEDEEKPKEDTTTDREKDSSEDLVEDVKGTDKDDVEMEVEEETNESAIGTDGESGKEGDKTVVESTMDEDKDSTDNIADKAKDDTIETNEVAMETDEVKKDVVKEVEEDVVEEVEEDVVKEVEEDVVEEVKEDVVEEVKEDVVEEVKEDVVEEVEEDVVEEVKEAEDTVEDVETDAVDEIREDVKEDVKEEVKEEVTEDVEEEVKVDTDAAKDDKDISMEVEEEAASGEKEENVIDISEDTAPEVKEETESTPVRGKRSSRKSRGSGETPSTPSTPSSSRSGTKRERKVANQYVPGNFELKKTANLAPVPGKGTKLKDIPKVKSNVEKLLAKDPSLSQAHKLLYGGRGNVAKKVVKKKILEFSGYLLADEEGTGKETENAATAEKFITRAKKMQIPLLKVICDIFDVDRTPSGKKTALGKDGIIDRLIEFIAAPDVKLTVSGKSKKRSRSASPRKTPKKKRARKSEEVEVEIVDEEMDEEGEEEEEGEVVKVTKGNNMPTKKELRKFVQAYVTCFSMEKTTTKHLIQTASDKFDVNVSSKKKDILDLLAEAMSD